MEKEFELKIGLDIVKVSFKSDYFDKTDTNEWECPHLEFRGTPISETGYRSHFFYKDMMNGKTIEEFAQNLAIKFNQELINIKKPRMRMKQEITPKNTLNNFFKVN